MIKENLEQQNYIQPSLGEDINNNLFDTGGLNTGAIENNGLRPLRDYWRQARPVLKTWELPLDSIKTDELNPSPEALEQTALEIAGSIGIPGIRSKEEKDQARTTLARQLLEDNSGGIMGLSSIGLAKEALSPIAAEYEKAVDFGANDRLWVRGYFAKATQRFIGQVEKSTRRLIKNYARSLLLINHLAVDERETAKQQAKAVFEEEWQKAITKKYERAPKALKENSAFVQAFNPLGDDAERPFTPEALVTRLQWLGETSEPAQPDLGSWQQIKLPEPVTAKVEESQEPPDNEGLTVTAEQEVNSNAAALAAVRAKLTLESARVRKTQKPVAIVEAEVDTPKPVELVAQPEPVAENTGGRSLFKRVKETAGGVLSRAKEGVEQIKDSFKERNRKRVAGRAMTAFALATIAAGIIQESNNPLAPTIIPGTNPKTAFSAKVDPRSSNTWTVTPQFQVQAVPTAEAGLVSGSEKNVIPAAGDTPQKREQVIAVKNDRFAMFNRFWDVTKWLSHNQEEYRGVNPTAREIAFYNLNKIFPDITGKAEIKFEDKVFSLFTTPENQGDFGNHNVMYWGSPPENPRLVRRTHTVPVSTLGPNAEGFEEPGSIMNGESKNKTVYYTPKDSYLPFIFLGDPIDPFTKKEAEARLEKLNQGLANGKVKIITTEKQLVPVEPENPGEEAHLEPTDQSVTRETIYIAWVPLDKYNAKIAERLKNPNGGDLADFMPLEIRKYLDDNRETTSLTELCINLPSDDRNFQDPIDPFWQVIKNDFFEENGEKKPGELRQFFEEYYNNWQYHIEGFIQKMELRLKEQEKQLKELQEAGDPEYDSLKQTYEEEKARFDDYKAAFEESQKRMANNRSKGRLIVAEKTIGGNFHEPEQQVTTTQPAQANAVDSGQTWLDQKRETASQKALLAQASADARNARNTAWR